MAAQPVWDDDEERRRAPGALRAAGRVDAAWQQRVDACHDRADEQATLIGEYAAIADQMAALARRREWSAQQVAMARRLAADAMRAVRLMESG